MPDSTQGGKDRWPMTCRGLTTRQTSAPMLPCYAQLQLLHADEIELLRNKLEYAVTGYKEAADEIERLTAALDDERKAHQVCVEMRDKAYADLDRPRADGTVIAVGGEPGASAGKSE